MFKWNRFIRSGGAVLLVVLFGFTVTFAAGPNQMTVNLPSFAIAVEKGSSGQAVFKNTALFGEPGSPELPCEAVRVLLPPDASVTSVKVSLTEVAYETLAGLWDVTPAPPLRKLSSGDGAIWPAGIHIVDGRNQAIYHNNLFYPAQNLGPVTVGQQRKWKLATIPVYPYQYNPVTRSLRHETGGKLVITYDKETGTAWSQSDPISDRMKANIAEKVLDFEEVAPQYEVTTLKMAAPAGTTYAAVTKPGYVIVTTEAVRRSSKMLDKFVSAKQTRGFQVEVVTESTWGGGTGDQAAENLRGWLQAHYLSDNIQYVLLIGNPDPKNGNVPMKMCWPVKMDTGEGEEQFYRKDCPTDAYYADLTGNWNIDGDANYGEWEDFTTAGGPDFNYEVVVGRIPYYGAVQDLDWILGKTINYGNIAAADAGWRNKFLFAMEPFEVNSDYPYGVEEDFRLGETIVNDVLKVKKGMKWFRIYEQNFDLNPVPERTPCDATAVNEVWSNNAFGAVVWATHGSQDGAAGIMNLQNVGDLNNSYPSYTFQASCDNSWPEDQNNLSYALLKQGAIGTVGATREIWSYYEPEGDYGKDIGYRYFKNMVSSNLAAGDALAKAKAAGNPSWDYYFMNYLDFNLYGDPSLGIFSYQQQPALYLTLPTIMNEMSTGQGQVSIPKALSSDLTVTLAGGESWLKLPAYVKIRAGQRSAKFAIEALSLDGLKAMDEYYKITAIKATAAGYTEGVNALRVNVTTSNCAELSVVTNISNQIKGRPFKVEMVALDTFGQRVTGYNGPVQLQLINLENSAESKDLQISMKSGKFTGEFTISDCGYYQFRLNGKDVSNYFFVDIAATPSTYSLFTSSTPVKGIPFEVTITALDAEGQRMTGYSGSIRPLKLRLYTKDQGMCTDFQSQRISMVDGVFTGEFTISAGGEYILNLELDNTFVVATCNLTVLDN